MPRFVENGPDIPESLLQAHEEGKVVFFCGAGISVPAGLPTFRELAERIYEELGDPQSEIEKRAYKEERYDALIHHIESRNKGNRDRVRTIISNILMNPNLEEDSALINHRALLALAKERNGGATRLVTTNFDRIFQYVIEKDEKEIPHASAPMLPVPKPGRWDGIVHLHGVLQEDPSRSEKPGHLVLGSGDFGLAYLTERWASRFITELFRNYKVVFVGYGINDPIMRYIMDALAVEGNKDHAWAFGNYREDCPGEKERETEAWKSKGVTPIMYKLSEGSQEHLLLQNTLRKWSYIYQDELNGKSNVISKYAVNDPSKTPSWSTNLVLWALNDEVAARHFSQMTPVYSIGWLDYLAEDRFGPDDFEQFRISSIPSARRNARISFLRRSAYYTPAPLMPIFSPENTEWDDISTSMANWSIRHLNNPDLILWLVRKGGRLHETFSRMVESKMNHIGQLEQSRDQAEIERIRADSPAAIPSPGMRAAWRLLMSGRYAMVYNLFDTYGWVQSFRQGGLTPSLKNRFRELLTPSVEIVTRMDKESEVEKIPESLAEIFYCNVVLRNREARNALIILQDDRDWRASLPELIPELNVLLRDVIALKVEIGEADHRTDRSCADQRSIRRHSQNEYSAEWTIIIDLLRDAWVVLNKIDSVRAKKIAEEWQAEPYPVFKRLSFFAAEESHEISPSQSLEWLLEDQNWWLWSRDTRRETIRLLVSTASRLSEQDRGRMEYAILRGPSRDMLNENISNETFQRSVDHMTWLRLAKLRHSGIDLGPNAQRRLEELEVNYPDWRIQEDESDEFYGYMYVNTVDDSQSTDWEDQCANEPENSVNKLLQQAERGEWPVDRWKDALRIWMRNRDGEQLRSSWDWLSSQLSNAPDEFLENLSHPLSFWLMEVVHFLDREDEKILPFINRFLDINHQDGAPEEERDLVFRALNHPIGHLAQALLKLWYNTEPEVEGGIEDEYRAVFTKICDVDSKPFRHGRVLLAERLFDLYRADEEWARECILPCFNWENSTLEARSVWQGFFTSPAFYPEMFSHLKDSFLEIPDHYEELGRRKQQFSSFLTLLSLESQSVFTTDELVNAARRLPLGGIKDVLWTLSRSLRGADEQRIEYWNNRVKPYLGNFLHLIGDDKKSSDFSFYLAEICIMMKDHFIEAWSTIKSSIGSIDDWMLYRVISQLRESQVCTQHPLEALEFVDSVRPDAIHQSAEEISRCLDEIQRAAPNLSEHEMYVRLRRACIMHISN